VSHLRHTVLLLNVLLADVLSQTSTIEKINPIVVGVQVLSSQINDLNESYGMVPPKREC